MRRHQGQPPNGTVIAELRTQAGLSQQELATAAGLGISTLWAWENRRGPTNHGPHAGKLRALAKALSDALGREIAPETLLESAPSESPEPAEAVA